MCNLYTYKMTVEEMRALKLHFEFIGTTWSEWEERQRRLNEPIEDVYPNKRAPVVILQDGEHVVREDMLWAFAEPDKTTPKDNMMWRWFSRADGLPFCFAEIWRPWAGDRGTKQAPNVGEHVLFSIMTTEPARSLSRSMTGDARQANDCRGR